MNNGNGKPIQMPGAAPHMVGGSQQIDLKQIAKDASRMAVQVVEEMVTEGELPVEYEAAAYGATMELLLTPVKESIRLSQQIQAQQAALRAQGVIVP